MGFYDDIDELDEYYKKAEVSEGGKYENVPDGKYQVRIDEVMTDETKAGKPCLKWKFVIISGPRTKQHIYKYSSLDLTKSAEYVQMDMDRLKTDLSICGVDLDSLSGLEVSLARLLDVRLEVTAKTKGEYQNVYINRKLDDADTPVNDDDIPF